MRQSQEMLEDILKNPTVRRVLRQQIKGVRKYDRSVDKDALPAKHWMQHLQEELVDAHVYSEVMVEVLDSIRATILEAMVHIERGEPEIAYYRMEEIVEQIGV